MMTCSDGIPSNGGDPVVVGVAGRTRRAPTLEFVGLGTLLPNEIRGETWLDIDLYILPDLPPGRRGCIQRPSQRAKGDGNASIVIKKSGCHRCY